MQYVKLVARPGTWFDEGTEVFEYDLPWEHRRRVTITEWNEWLPFEYICVQGQRNGDVDGESCAFVEFDMEVVETSI